MNRSTADNAGATEKRRGGAAARVRGMVAGLAFFAAGIALSAWWFMRAPARAPAAPESAGRARAFGGHQGGSSAPGFTG